MGGFHASSVRFAALVFCILAAVGGAAGSAPAQPAQKRTTELGDFKNHYRDLKNRADKVEAIFSLDKEQGVEFAEALLPMLAKDEDAEVRAAAVKVLTHNEAPATIEFLIGLLKKKDPNIRPGVCQVLGAGRRLEAVVELEKIIKDGDFLAKYRAAEALGKIGKVESAEALTTFLTKESEADLRIAALDSLGFLKQESAGPAVVAALAAKDWRVRAAAIRALATVRTKAALEPLVKIISGDEGRLVEDAARTLKALSGRDFGKEYQTWQVWYDREAKDPKYKLPTVDELAKIEARKAEMPKAGETGVIPVRKGAEFMGVETPSRKVMFIIDTSGSMEDLIVEKDRYRNQNYPGFRKIDIVKEELARTIQRLDSKTDFSIVTFATKVKPWKKGALIQANPINRAAAIEYARGLEPIGGHSKEELESAGLGSAAALGEGKTNTFGALMFGLGNPQRGVIEKSQATDVDTIFYLSDGKPSCGDIVDTDEIFTAICDANSQRRITIHVLAIGDFEKGWMKRLAESNAGVFVDLGK